MRTPIYALLAVLGLSSVAVGQTTYVVDSTGNGQFRDIQPAVDAAVDGDRILVRRGSYTSFVVDGKGISVLGTTGVSLQDQLVSVRNTASNQTVVLSDLERISAFGLFVGGLSNCAGTVLLERVQTRRFWADRMADLRINQCTLGESNRVTNSRVTVSDSQLFGGPFLPGPAPGITIIDSNVTMSRCAVSGQSQFIRSPASPAISMSGETLVTLTGDGSNGVSAGQPSSGGQSAIVGAGTLIRDPRVRIAGANGAPPVTVLDDRVLHVPSLQALGAPVGGMIEVDLTGLTGEIFGLVFGLPDAPLGLPGIRGSLGILPIASEVGVFATNSIHRSFVAGAGLPPGFTICWQAVAGDGQGGFVLSNHATYTRTR